MILKDFDIDLIQELAVLGSIDCLMGMASSAALLPFAGRVSRSVVDRLQPIRNPASAGFRYRTFTALDFLCALASLREIGVSLRPLCTLWQIFSFFASL